MAPNRKTLLAGGLVLGAILVAGVGYALADANRPNHGEFTEADGKVTGAGVTFLVDVATGTLTSLDAAGANNTTVRLAERVTVAPAAATTNTDEVRGGAYVMTLGDAARLVVGDGSGAFGVQATNETTVTIVLPGSAAVTLHDAVADWSPAGATVDYGSSKANLVLADGATVTREGNTLTVHLDAGQGLTFRVLGAECPHGGMRDGHGPGFGPRGGGFPGFGRRHR